MKHYFVGADDSSFFKKRTTWSFAQALEAANDGDTIELEQNYSPYVTEEINAITLDKNITIRGTSYEENEQVMITNVFPQIHIVKGTQVRLEHIIIEGNVEKRNLLNLGESASVNLERVIIRNLAEEGEYYPIVFLKNNSKLHMEKCLVNSGPNPNEINKIYSEHAEITIINSDINTNIEIKDDSKLILEGSQVNVNRKHEGIRTHDSSVVLKDARVANNAFTTLFAINSYVEVKSTKLEGGFIDEDKRYSCVKLMNSKLQFNDVTIIQPNYTHALYLVESQGEIDQLYSSSIILDQSAITYGYIQAYESFHMFNKSEARGKRLDVLGRDNGRINIFLKTHSDFQAETVNIGKETNPNIKMDNSSEYKVENQSINEFDENTQGFKVNDENYLIPINKEIKIQYFGDKTALQRLYDLVGIQQVKEEVESFIAFAELNKRREKENQNSDSTSLHSLFLGNPGTGKTTVARLIGEILYDKNIVRNKNFREVSRSDLVGQHVGHTAMKTREVLESTLGGVLFIDEAYTLASDSKNDFGREAIDELLKFMEDHRGDIVLIFAGYTDDMNRFLEMNDGLRSRIPNHFNFPDYTADEIIQVGLIDLNNREYNINEKIYGELVEYKYNRTYDKSNGRWIRNLNELIMRKSALRIMGDADADINTITEEDLKALMN